MERGLKPVQLRRSNLYNEVYAVFGRRGGFYICFCLNDRRFFRMPADLLKRRTTPVNGPNAGTLATLVRDLFPFQNLAFVNNLKGLNNGNY